MTFYHEELTRIHEHCYPKNYLTAQVIRAKQFMDTHYTEAISLDHIAGNAFLSKFHFIRLFKAHYGRTPHQYLMSVRIEQARRLLASGVTVSETCFAVGFDSVTWFTELFKKKTGYTPAVFARMKR